jgi:diguanylate cyclase (GGDEF)-like protein/PAS domain S-box-containing protein
MVPKDEMPSNSPIVRHLIVSLVFLGVFLLLNLPQVILISQIGFTAWYPDTGLMLVLMLGISPWYAPLVAVAGAFAGFVIYHLPVWSYSQTVSIVGITGCYALAAYLLRGPLKIDMGLRRRRDVLWYVMVTLSMGAVATAVGVGCLLADHAIRREQLWSSAEAWFFGDAIALLSVAPFLLIHVLPVIRPWILPPEDRPKQQRPRLSPRTLIGSAGAAAEAAAQVLTLAVAIWVMVQERWGHPFYLAFIPVIWISMRHGIRRASTGVLALNFGIVLVLGLHIASKALLGNLGLFMLVASAIGLIGGSAATERHRIGMELHLQTAYMQSLMENSPLGIAVLDSTGHVDFANPAFEELSFYHPGELAGRYLNSLFLTDGSATNAVAELAPVFHGEKLHRTVRWRRQDGKVLDLDLHAVPLHEDGAVRRAYTIYQDISEQVKAATAKKDHAEARDRLVKELELRTQQMSWLSEMGDLLECCESETESGQVICRFIRMVMPEATCGSLYTFRASRNLLGTVNSWGDKDDHLDNFSPSACWGLRRGCPHWSLQDIRCSHFSTSHQTEYLCIPMVGRGETLGLLTLGFKFDSLAENDADEVRNSRLRLGGTIAGQIALSLASLRLRETLRDQSIRDPLTGLFNRRFMEESLEKEIQRASRKHRQLSILCIDIDHFKRFNDTFGHEAGDQVLRAIADVFRNSFRGEDVVCRQGGEEFTIILPEASGEDAALRAERLCQEVRNQTFKHLNQMLGPVTISIGVAAFPQHATNIDGLLRIADECLYNAKSIGRDRVIQPEHARCAAQGSQS